MYTKKGLSAVVAVSLLLVVAVTSVITFQNWFLNYSSGVTTDIEGKNAASQTLTKVNQVQGENLYIKNDFSTLSIKDIEIDGQSCGISGNYSDKLVRINISACTGESSSYKEITVITDKSVFSQKVSFEKFRASNPVIIELTQESSYSNSTLLDSPEDLFIINDVLFVLFRDGVSVLNISDKNNPILVNSLDLNLELSSPTELDYNNGYIYITDNLGDKVLVVNASEPSSLTYVSSFSNATSLNGANSIKVKDNLAYVLTSENDSLTILNVSDVNSITQISSYFNTTLFEQGRSLDIKNDIVYTVAMSSHLLTAINVSDPTSPVVLDFISESISFPNTVNVFGDYGYVSSGSGDKLVIINISDSFNLNEVGTFSNATSLNGLYDFSVEGSYAFLPGSDSDSLVVVDISNNSLPEQLDVYSNSSSVDYPTGVAVSESYLYLIGRYSDSLGIIKWK